MSQTKIRTCWSLFECANKQIDSGVFFGLTPLVEKPPEKVFMQLREHASKRKASQQSSFGYQKKPTGL